MEAGGPAEVLEFVAEKGLRPVSIKPISMLGPAKRNIFGGGVTVTDQVFLTKYLALMLKVGTDLFSAIDILIADFDKPSVKAILIEMRTNLGKGKPFYSTFAAYPRIFSSVFVNMIRAGEVSGNLDKVFEDLSVRLERDQALRGKIKGALVYPLILMGASVFILIILVSFALPKLSEVFSSGNFDPPAFSRIVFAIGLFFGRWVWIILPAFLVGTTAFIVFLRQSVTFRTLVFHFFGKLPFIREVLKRIAIQRFASTLASLLKSGLPILDALEITANAVGNDEMRGALQRISREGITKGQTIGESFRREAAFPKVVTNLIAISEKSGHIDEILRTLADFYESEIDVSLKSLVSLLEPLLLMGIGVVIAVIALAIIVPIYQLVGQFS